MYQHATHFSKPNEQLKILRISALLPVTSTIMLVGILVPESYFYIHPWADVMQALTLGNFFLLMLEFISPYNHERESFFENLKVPAWRRSKKLPRDGRAWYKMMRFFVFQFWPVELGVAAVTDITQIPSINLYCADHNKPQFAHTWVSACPSPLTNRAHCTWASVRNAGVLFQNHRLTREVNEAHRRPYCLHCFGHRRLFEILPRPRR